MTLNIHKPSPLCCGNVTVYFLFYIPIEFKLANLSTADPAWQNNAYDRWYYEGLFPVLMQSSLITSFNLIITFLLYAVQLNKTTDG